MLSRQLAKQGRRRRQSEREHNDGKCTDQSNGEEAGERLRIGHDIFLLLGGAGLAPACDLQSKLLFRRDIEHNEDVFVMCP